MKNLLVLFSLLLASCIPEGDSILVDARPDKQEVVEPSKEQETPAEDAGAGVISDDSEEDDHRHSDVHDWRETLKTKVLTCYDLDDFTNYDKANWAALLIICQAAEVMGYNEVTITSDWRTCEGNNRSQHCGGGAVDFFFGSYSGNELADNEKYDRDFDQFYNFLYFTGLIDKSGLAKYLAKRIIHYDLRGDGGASWCEVGRDGVYVALEECLESLGPS